MSKTIKSEIIKNTMIIPTTPANIDAVIEAYDTKLNYLGLNEEETELTVTNYIRIDTKEAINGTTYTVNVGSVNTLGNKIAA